MSVQIRPFERSDERAVVALWEECRLTRPWNDPHKDIARKLAVQPELFVVGVVDGAVMASVMAGYEGHRGWGLRIDHILLSPDLVAKCTACTIDVEPRKRERPSDHAPVIAELK